MQNKQRKINKNCFIYARTACVNLTRTGNSIEHQVKTCLEYAGKNNFRVIKIYKDDGVSGNSTYKPMFTKMLDRCKLGEADSFIVSSIDRITRNSVEYSELKKYLTKVGIKYYSATEEMRNNESLEANLFDSILVLMDTYYLKCRYRNRLKIRNANTL